MAYWKDVILDLKKMLSICDGIFKGSGPPNPEVLGELTAQKKKIETTLQSFK